eukprot:4423152-Prymnesium_polylepis.2
MHCRRGPLTSTPGLLALVHQVLKHSVLRQARAQSFSRSTIGRTRPRSANASRRAATLSHSRALPPRPATLRSHLILKSKRRSVLHHLHSHSYTGASSPWEFWRRWTRRSRQAASSGAGGLPVSHIPAQA